MTVPKLKERAKEIADLQGVGGMKKGELIKAIAKAEGISLELGSKDFGTISSVKEDIQALKKQKEEILSSSGARSQLGGIRKKIKILKRQTRQMALFPFDIRLINNKYHWIVYSCNPDSNWEWSEGYLKMLENDKSFPDILENISVFADTTQIDELDKEQKIVYVVLREISQKGYD